MTFTRSVETCTLVTKCDTISNDIISILSWNRLSFQNTCRPLYYYIPGTYFGIPLFHLYSILYKLLYNHDVYIGGGGGGLMYNSCV